MKWAAAVLTVSTIVVFAVSPAHAAYTHTWTASSGQFPDADCFWHLITTNPALATFDSGQALVILVSEGRESAVQFSESCSNIRRISAHGSDPAQAGFSSFLHG